MGSGPSKEELRHELSDVKRKLNALDQKSSGIKRELDNSRRLHRDIYDACMKDDKRKKGCDAIKDDLLKSIKTEAESRELTVAHNVLKHIFDECNGDKTYKFGCEYVRNSLLDSITKLGDK